MVKPAFSLLAVGDAQAPHTRSRSIAMSQCGFDDSLVTPERFRIKELKKIDGLPSATGPKVPGLIILLVFAAINIQMLRVSENDRYHQAVIANGLAYIKQHGDRHTEAGRICDRIKALVTNKTPQGIPVPVWLKAAYLYFLAQTYLLLAKAK